MNNLEKTLTDALMSAGLSSLPKEGSDNLWIKAIVEVKKCDNSSNYAIAVNNVDGKPNIVQDFGNMARIVSIGKIYPYYIMPKSAIPDLRNRQDITSYLESMGVSTAEETAKLFSKKKEDGTDKTTEEIKADKDTIKNLVLQTAFKAEMMNYKEYTEARKRQTL